MTEGHSSGGCNRVVVPIGELLHELRQGGTSKGQSDKTECAAIFCTLENFETAVVYLSRELQALGLGSLNITSVSSKNSSCRENGERFTTNTYKGTLLNIDIVCLINRCWEVVQLYRSCMRDGSTLKEQRKLDIHTTNKLQATIADLQSSKEENLRKLKEACEHKRQAIEAKNSLEKSLKYFKEELKALHLIMRNHDSQYRHELKKKEQYNQCLKDRLAQMLAGPASIVEKRMELTAPLAPKDDKPRAKWNTIDNSRHNNDVYQRVVAQYEAWMVEVVGERDALLSALQSVAASLQQLVKKHAKVMTAEEMAASLTDSVYSTDSLDEPVGGNLPRPGGGSTALLGGLNRQCGDLIIQLNVMLSEKSSNDLRELRVKRIDELTADALMLAGLKKATGASTSGKMSPSLDGDISSQSSSKMGMAEEKCSESREEDGKQVALKKLAKHLGIDNSEMKVVVDDKTETPKISKGHDHDTNTPDTSAKPHATSTPDLVPQSPNPSKPQATPSLEGLRVTPDITEGLQVTPTVSEGSTPGWLQRAGGPDDSTGTEIMSLKKLLEDERAAVKRERESFTSAALRLNRERAEFEQEKLEFLKQEFLQEIPSNLKPDCDVDAAFYQVSRVPAWISEHHCRPFSPPSLGAPLMSEPNFAPPASVSGSAQAKQMRSTNDKARDHSSGSRDSTNTLVGSRKSSAPSTRAPSESRQSDAASQRSLPRSISSGSNAKSRRSPSISRLSLGGRDVKKATAGKQYSYREAIRPNVKSHDCSGNNSRDSSVSRGTRALNTSKYMPNKPSTGAVKTSSQTNRYDINSQTNRYDINSAAKKICSTKNSTSGEGIVSRVALQSRQSCDTPPSRYGARTKNSSRNNALHGSNSLPRQLGKTQSYLISSTNLTDKFEESRHAKSLDSPSVNFPSMHSRYVDGDYPNYLTADGRPKSDILKQSGKIFNMYGSLPPELVGRPDDLYSIDSGYQQSEASCAGHCKKFLNIPMNMKCLCHLLKPRTSDSDEIDVSEAQSEEFESNTQNLVTNERINALECSLMNLISQIEARDESESFVESSQRSKSVPKMSMYQRKDSRMSGGLDDLVFPDAKPRNNVETTRNNVETTRNNVETTSGFKNDGLNSGILMGNRKRLSAVSIDN